ncbi:hypothetical protein [Methylococcus sp. EFPC2]|uniref:hypothetical protein n=1 Tax=Methylococcus sp. EFPC2 TaxID=2812648 RepID=UPI0019686E22|nr:hypothetical protein [Methylococcus sp. EFPC2]QSA97098.1 hypothetical protein JWZ97_18210 [Methylococcus sp. EFPC2]
MLHELWVELENEQTFCLAGAQGEAARKLLGPTARLVWSVEAGSHFEAMTQYYEYMGWGVYKSDFPELDKKLYSELGWK